MARGAGTCRAITAGLSYKIDEAVRHGASGVLIIDGPPGAAIPWARLVAESAGVHLDRAPDGASAAPPVVEGWVSEAGARTLFAAAGIDYAATLAAAGAGGFMA